MRGWRALTVLLGLIVVFCGVGTWSLLTWIAPVIFPIAEVWPGASIDLWMWVCFGGILAGALLSFSIDYSSLWTNRLPLMSDAGSAASSTGAALGALIAAITIASLDPTDPWAILIIAAIGALFAGLAWRKMRSATRETRDHRRRLERLRDLHARGSQVRAEVEDVHFHHTWFWNEPVFTVTARYDTPSGERRGSGQMITPAADAPLIGGTALLWFAGDGSDSENIDIAQDPDSIRDPDAGTTYRAPQDI